MGPEREIKPRAFRASRASLRKNTLWFKTFAAPAPDWGQEVESPNLSGRDHAYGWRGCVFPWALAGLMDQCVGFRPIVAKRVSRPMPSSAWLPSSF
jgi:hypothetical protein